MKTISILNLKGGCGKTTISLALCYKAELMKKKILMIDLDGQCNLSENFKLLGKPNNALSIMDNEASIERCIYKINDFVSVIPSCEKISLSDKLLDGVGKEHLLEESLEKVKKNYDYCIIDNPPALGICVVNSLVASDYALVPVKSGDIYSLSAIPQVIDVILNVNKYYNKKLKFLGFVLNEYKPRSSFDLAIESTLEDISKEKHLKILSSHILKSVIIEQNKNSKENIFLKNKKNKAIISLDEFTDEVFSLIK